jgi:hypothetical protein
VSERDIQKAARRHRAEQANAAAKLDRDLASRGSRQAKYEAAMLDEALGESGGSKWLTTAALIVGFLGPAVLGFVVLPSRLTGNLLVIFGETLVMLTTMFIMFRLAEVIIARRRMSQLRQIGRGFDLESYLQALRSNRQGGTLIARVRFERPFDRDTRTAIPDAVPTWWHEVGRVTWSIDDELVIESKEIDGTDPCDHARTGIYRTFNNARFHTAFLAVIQRVLPHLGKVAPIASFQVVITGTTSAWDVDR